MSENTNEGVLTGALATDRKDAWWVGPLLTAMGLGAFGVYSTIRAFANADYEWGPYLSPFYSPLIRIPGLNVSPAFLILWAPAGFRATCYYYRKAYYRAFFQHPTACAVNEIHGHSYRGETSFPFIFQNIHRYFMYVAVLFIGILWYDAISAFFFPAADGTRHFGMGLGSLIMVVNVLLLGSYTFGCHSLRHVIGGKMDCFSCTSFGKVQHKTWLGVSWFNNRHMLFAWCSLFSVGLTDFYVWLCATGRINDFRFF
ncbi:MAG: succinate dehydrogenase [Deltaproteobacteria bacterium]|nr:succinate dehydrogenase [Deltaproteobacteria bacterium]